MRIRSRSKIIKKQSCKANSSRKRSKVYGRAISSSLIIMAVPLMGLSIEAITYSLPLFKPTSPTTSLTVTTIVSSSSPFQCESIPQQLRVV